ncbi:hypothetical protein K0P19_21810 [Shinella sp. YE25]|nr:hypothetical protein [Shinella sp. YE25]
MAHVSINVAEHEHSHAITEAARFLATVPPTNRPKPLVPALKEMFGLNSLEACLAITESHELRRELA